MNQNANGKSKKNLLTVIVVIAAVVLGYYFFAGNSNTAAPAAASVAVRVGPVTVEDIPIIVTQVGNAVANQSVAIRSRIDSQIMEVRFHDGDEVKAGDILFVLDDRTLVAQHNQDLANLVNLKAQFERTSALIQKQYVSKADLDQARAAYEAQKAMVDSIATQIEYTRIRAPIDGRTGTINFTVGNTVKANDLPLVTLNQIKPIRVQLSLPQQYLEQVRKSMQAGEVPVTAQHAGGNVISTGKLEYIDNAVDSSSGTFAARALFANEDESLWPGTFVTCEIKLGLQQGAVTVPEVAVQHGQSGDYVFVIANNKAQKRPIQLDRMQNGKAIIAKGIQADEIVAIDGMMSLKDGNTVTINTENPTPPANR